LTLGSSITPIDTSALKTVLSKTSYWAFISYNSHDRSCARWLQRALENYRIPHRLVGRATPVGPAPKRLRPIFRDRTDLAADPNLRAKVESVLAESAYLIVICSPQAAASRWVEREIQLFQATHGSSRILAVILAGEPNDTKDGCFPPSLRDAEPVAADLRSNGDGRRGTLLKICAGILGVSLDELVRRDVQRRHRRLIGVTVASIAGMAVAGALAALAFRARNEAQAQRAHAERLIEFMLTDLRKALEPSGRLDLMDGVGRQTLEYYDAQDPRRLDAQSLARRARALRLMGEINVQRGNLTDALGSFHAASATTAELMKRSADDGQIIFNHAQNVFWIGDIARQRGDLDAAEKAFRQYQSLAQRLIALNPKNDDWREEIVYANSALGVLYLAEGRPADALTPFAQTFPIVESLAHRYPDDMNRQVDLGQAHAWLANALQKLGGLTEARAHRDAELMLYRSVLIKDPTFRAAKFSTVVCLLDRGQLASLSGSSEAAFVDFKEAAGEAEALLINERDNMDLRAVVAMAHVDLGELLLAAGQVDPARTEQMRARNLLDASRDQGVALWRNYSDRATLLEAAIDAQVGHQLESLALDQAMLGRLESTKGIRVNTEPFWLLQRSRVQTGDDLAALGRTGEAHAEWTMVVKNLSGPLQEYEPRLLVVLGTADRRLGELTEANAVARHLEGLLVATGR
jgi:tetratricopeptide (TPR) repeat protein